MMPRNYLLREIKGGYKFTKSQKKMNYLNDMDDIQFFAMNEKDLATNN